MARPRSTAARTKIQTPRSLHQPTTPPLPFQYKRSLNSNSGTIVLWDTGPSPSQAAGFPNKVTVPCPSNSSLDLLTYRVASSTGFGLSNIINVRKHAWHSSQLLRIWVCSIITHTHTHTHTHTLSCTCSPCWNLTQWYEGRTKGPSVLYSSMPGM